MHPLYNISLALSLILVTQLCSACSIRSHQVSSAKPPVPATPSSQASSAPGTPAPAIPESGLDVQRQAANPPAKLIEDLKNSLAQQLGISSTEVSVQTTIAETWRDSCLGMISPNELCAQVITPGYRIVLQTPTGSYTFHTDERGQQVRQVPGGREP